MSYLTDLEKQNRFLKEANIELHKTLKNKEVIIGLVINELSIRPLVTSNYLLKKIQENTNE